MPSMLAAVSRRPHAQETASLLTSSEEQAENPQIGKPRLIAGPSVWAISTIASDGVAVSTLSQLRHPYQISRKEIRGALADHTLRQRGEQKILRRLRGAATIEDGHEVDDVDAALLS